MYSKYWTGFPSGRLYIEISVLYISVIIESWKILLIYQETCDYELKVYICDVTLNLAVC